MKKSNKTSNQGKKLIRYISLASGLVVASLPGKAKADLLNVNASVGVPGLAAVGAGVNVGNGVNVGVGANVLGIGGTVGVNALSVPTCYTTATYPVQRRVVYAAQPVATTYVANPDVVYRTIRPTVSCAYRPAPVVYQTAPVQSGVVSVKESYDASSYETPDTEYSKKEWSRSVDNPVKQYRSNEYHRETITRRVYYTYE